MKLYGHPESGHAFKVKFFLHVFDVSHEYIEVDIFAPRNERLAEFMAFSKFHEVPMLIDQDQAMVQSNAILVYLADKYNRWGGEADNNKQRCLEWLNWEANKIGMCLPQLRVAKRFPEDAANTGALEWLLQRYLHDVDILNKELSDGRRFILGDEPTVADFSLCGYLFFANEAEVNVPTNVERWLQTLQTLPGWKHPYQLLKA